MKGPDLTIEIGASRRLTYLVAAIHLLAVGAVLLAGISWSYRVPIIFSLVMSMGFYLKTWPRQKVKLRCRADGGLALWAAEDWDEARVLPDTLVLPWCGILRYQRTGRPRPETCVILPDSLNGDDFRQLRVWLKFRASALPASGDAY
jgi:hypothetical protein